METKNKGINKERLIETFQRLVAIDAPSFQERAMADVLKEELTRLGFSVEEDEAGNHYGGNAGNVHGFRKGTISGTPILFSTHMDTVEPARGKKALVGADGRITSDGTTVLGADCMSGTAAILEALQEIEEDGVECRDLEVIFFIGEEKHLRGSAVFDYSRVKAKESYILDLTGPVGTAAYQAPTLIEFRIEVKGRAAHAGFAPETGVHAIAIAARAVAQMELGHVGEEMTVNIGLIHGGGSTSNVVPEYCELIGEVRSYSHEQAMEQTQKIEELFKEEAGRAGGSVHMECQVLVRAYRTPDEHPCMGRFRRACESLGLPCTLIKTFGGSDQSNLFQHGISGLVLASAMELVHSCQEYVEIAELVKITELVRFLMQNK